MRRAIGLVLAATIVTACAAASSATEPPMSVHPSPAGSAMPSPQATLEPAPSPTREPAPSQHPTPVPQPTQDDGAETLSIGWHADDPTGLSALIDPPTGVARSGDTFVFVGEVPYAGEGWTFAAWWSTDGRSWVLAKEFPVDHRILDLVAAGPGFVATGFDDGGGSAWVSRDGRSWNQVKDPSLGQAVIRELVPTAGGIVGFGWEYDSGAQGIWTSPDGLEWLAATNESGRKVANGLRAVGSYDGRAIALVDQDDDRRGLAVFETTGRAEWQEIGRFPKTTLNIHKVVGGPRGWVALGDNHSAWASPDGRRWSDADLGPDVASDVIADQSGFVAVGWVGSLPDETCGDQRPFAGHTWTSSDGTVWKQMPVTKGFRSAMVTNLLVVDRTLVGYGLRIGGLAGGDGMPVGRWTAHLPEVTTSAGFSDEGSVPKSCGG